MALLLKRLLLEEDGLGTVELVLILAVLVGVALIFRRQMFQFVDTVVARIFGNQEVLDARFGIPQSSQGN